MISSVKIYKEVESVIEADGDVVQVLNHPESSNNKESEEDEAHVGKTEECRDRKPYTGFSQVLEIRLKTFK